MLNPVIPGTYESRQATFLSIVNNIVIKIVMKINIYDEMKINRMTDWKTSLLLQVFKNYNNVIFFTINKSFFIIELFTCQTKFSFSIHRIEI